MVLTTFKKKSNMNTSLYHIILLFIYHKFITSQGCSSVRVWCMVGGTKRCTLNNTTFKAPRWFRWVHVTCLHRSPFTHEPACRDQFTASTQRWRIPLGGRSKLVPTGRALLVPDHTRTTLTRTRLTSILFQKSIVYLYTGADDYIPGP